MRCKKCGSKLTFDNEICPGCGRSMVELNGHNEIEYDDSVVLNIESIIKKEEVKQEVVEEKISNDVFGDAINTTTPIIEPIKEEIKQDVNYDEISSEPVSDIPLEKIGASPLSTSEEIKTEPITTNRLESIVNNKEDDLFIEKKSKKGFIFGIIALIILLLGGVFAYFYIKTAPKKIFSSVITSASNMINTNITEPNTITNGFYFNINFEESKEENQMYDILNNLSINFDSKIDKQNKNTSFNLTAKYKEEDLISGDAYVTQDNAYIFLKDIYDKFITLPIDPNMLSTLYTTNYVNSLNVIKEVLKEIDKSLDKKYFTRSIDKLNVISSLTLNQETYKEFMKTLSNNIKNNQNIISNLSAISGQTEEDIKNLLDDEDYDFKGQLTITITANVLDSKITKVELSTKENDISDKLVIDVLNNNVYNFEISGETSTKGALTITNKNEYTEYKFTINDQEFGKVNYNFGYKIKYNESVNIPNVENSILYSELTNEDMENITTKLFEKKSIASLYSEINSLFPESTTEEVTE